MNTDKEIFDSYKSGNIIYITADGMEECPINDIINQTSDNILKSLNRTEDIILNVHNRKPDSLKWINDYAVANVIKTLKQTLVNTSSAEIKTNSTEDLSHDILQNTYNELFEEKIKLEEQLKNSNDLLDKYKSTIQKDKNEIAILNNKLAILEHDKQSYSKPFNIMLTINPNTKNISYNFDNIKNDISNNDNITDIVNNLCDNAKANTEANAEVPDKVNNSNGIILKQKTSTNSFMSDDMPNMTI